MTCANCEAAHRGANWPGYHAGCRSCTVRALANGPQFFGAARAGQITPAYQAALLTLLGKDWKAGHEEVKAEHHRLQALKKGGRP